jgi:hypothetical protein
MLHAKKHRDTPFIIYRRVVENWKPEETVVLQVPLRSLKLAVEKLSEQHDLMLVASCKYLLAKSETVDTLAIVHFVSGKPTACWTSDIVGTDDAVACAWEKDNHSVSELMVNLLEGNMEKEGTPTPLGKTVNFDLTKPEKIEQISITLKGGRPTNVEMTGDVKCPPADVAKVLRRAANLLTGE